MLKVKEIKASSIITKSNLPAADFVINPYVGCTHRCLYCYARFMKRFTGHNEPWGEFVDVKINAVDLMPTKPGKYKGKSIFMSSVTDPYLALEKKYQLTRRLLEKLIPLEPTLSIQSKSDLIVRDADLLRQFKNCEAGLTITTLDDKVRKEIEPYASTSQQRIEALKKLKEAGIRTHVFIGPILPGLTDWQGIIRQTKRYASFYMLENLNVSGSVWDSVKRWLKAKHPQLLPEYEKIYFGGSDYWGQKEKKIKEFCRSEKINCRIFFHHQKIRKNAK
ncbi:MAG: radical SAM protein [Patescibacteria group bacterium]